MSYIPLRLAFYYVAMFAAVGVHLPFWPVWLKAQGLDAAEIGILLAIAFGVRGLGNPIVGALVDRRGDRRRPLVVMAAGTLAAFALYLLADGFWSILGVTILAVGLWAPMFPIGENLCLLTIHGHGLDYGRIRLWGSLSFIAAAALAGKVLEFLPSATVLPMVIVGLTVVFVSCLALPEARTPRSGKGKAGMRSLLSDRAFLTFLVTCGLLQMSHQIYYGFSTLHWQAAGISPTTIGMLWAEGVIAEVVLLYYAGRLVARLGPARLLILAGLGGVVRWSVMGLTTAVPILAIIQLLHALTFAATHIGAMAFMQKATPPGLSARAQSLYSSIPAGAAPGLAMLAAGPLYAAVGGWSFEAMAVLAGLGALAATGIGRASRMEGQEETPPTP